MRVAPLALLPLLLATPALAQAPARAPSPEAAARALQDPLVREAAAAYLDQLADIVLDTRVGPAERLSDPHARTSDTLRDVQERDDPQFERHLHEGTKRALDTSAAVAGSAAVQAAELKRTAARLQAAIGPLLNALSAPPAGR